MSSSGLSFHQLEIAFRRNGQDCAHSVLYEKINGHIMEKSFYLLYLCFSGKVTLEK